MQLEEARKGWQSVIDRNNKLYVDARDGKLETVTQLVADALLQDGKGNDNVKYINGTNAPNADALRAISAIRFGGVLPACFVSFDTTFALVAVLVVLVPQFRTVSRFPLVKLKAQALKSTFRLPLPSN